jgi:hypothetical protein
VRLGREISTICSNGQKLSVIVHSEPSVTKPMIAEQMFCLGVLVYLLNCSAAIMRSQPHASKMAQALIATISQLSPRVFLIVVRMARFGICAERAILVYGYKNAMTGGLAAEFTLVAQASFVPSP